MSFSPEKDLKTLEIHSVFMTVKTQEDTAITTVVRKHTPRNSCTVSLNR